jgi:hypothetical protein
MTRLAPRTLVAVVIVASVMLPAARAFAQGAGITTSLSGLVTDASGAVIPGATVVIRNNTTAAVSETFTDSVGRFTLPALNPGTYTVTISLTGFKTAVLPDVPVNAAIPANVRAILEVGALTETVVVTGRSEVVQTQTAAVQTTLVAQQMQALPLVSRTALDYAVNLPGVSTPDSTLRSSTISGLPGEAINITVDGINAQDNRLKQRDGFFMMTRTQMDSVEEVTVSTATPGSEANGQGAVQVRVVTRSGSNRFSGAVYNTWRNQAGVASDDVVTRARKSKWIWGLNTAYWFNKRDVVKTTAGEYFINDVRLQMPGFRVGGPIITDKLFYFFNLEWFLSPVQPTYTRYLVNEAARSGYFTYPATDGSGNRSVPLLAIAAANGQTSTMDPTVAKLLADIRNATQTEGAVEAYNVNVDKYTYAWNVKDTRYFPTLRIDYNLGSSQRVTFSARYLNFDVPNGYPSQFPGFPNKGGQYSQRYMWQGTWRSTIGKNVVNEARVGSQSMTGRGGEFLPEVSESQFNCAVPGCQRAGDKGWALGISAFMGITNAANYNFKLAENAPLWSVEDTVTWLKGRHTFSTGASWTKIHYRGWRGMTLPVVPNVTFGLSPLDPAYTMLDATSGNYPGGITPVDAENARALYAVLTGRVTGVSGGAYLGPDGRYEYLGDQESAAGQTELGFYVSDSWRVKPNLTLTGGLRYELQLPFTTDGYYSRPETWGMVYGVTGSGPGPYGSGNLYRPGTLTGAAPLVVAYEDGRPAYNTDWNNLAPSVGAAWRPALREGFLSRILSKDPVFRGGYSLSYSRLGTEFFHNTYTLNPGRSRAADRTTTTGTPLLGSDTVGAPQVFPVLLRDTSRLFPGAFPESPTYPITPAVNEAIDSHYPDWPTPQTHQYSAGFQRELGKSMAVDIRYVGNTNVGGWTRWNVNAPAQWSMLAGENRFYDEFRTAQANLRANILAGRGTTFAYTGEAGTAPLPIFLAYLQGIPLNDARNQNPATYTATQFRNSAWYNSLSMYSPALTTVAGTGTAGLQNAAFAANARTAGLPANFFMANPALAQGAAWLETSGGNTRYNALQVEVRRRMTGGLLVGGSYVFDFGRKAWAQRSLRENWFYVDSTGGPRHALKFNWVYELPFGRGKPFGGDASRWVDALIGGWEFSGLGRVQSGLRFDYGGYRLVGMTEQEFQDMFEFYHVINPTVPDANGRPMDRVYMLPQDVIQNSILALYTTSATTGSGYAGALPTGRYLAPASGPDCVQYLSGMCPGTEVVRVVTGPMYWKIDMSFVKRIPVVKNVRVEARMDLYNVFDTINFASTTAMGRNVTDWQVTAAARDPSSSQDYGGRITQFGLRVTW